MTNEECDKELKETENFIKDLLQGKTEFSPKLKELAKRAVKRKEERDAMLDKMTPEEQKKYWAEWAEIFAKSMCDPNALGGS